MKPTFLVIALSLFLSIAAGWVSYPDECSCTGNSPTYDCDIDAEACDKANRRLAFRAKKSIKPFHLIGKTISNVTGNGTFSFNDLPQDLR